MNGPAIGIEAGQIRINQDVFRALELTKLPEDATRLGMIQSLTQLPFPMDLSVRIRGRDGAPIVRRLERKRNVLTARTRNAQVPLPQIDSQVSQINGLLNSLATRSEPVYDVSVIVGTRFPPHLAAFQRAALADIGRAAARMNFCEVEECTLLNFDAFLECVPTFRGRNLKLHTVLGSNAVHLLPIFRPATGDDRQVMTFQTRERTIFGLDPTDKSLANYNWLVSGTSGAGKSFFVNSLIAQSESLNPNVFIVDIGGSYNKLTKYLGGKVFSIEPGQGFKLGPLFAARSDDPDEEQLRREHVLQIFLEMTRVDGKLPEIEVRAVLREELAHLLDRTDVIEHPISELVDRLNVAGTREATRLSVLLEPWAHGSFNARFLDNGETLDVNERILTFDLKGLTDFGDLGRVVQLIICASLWAKIRRRADGRFSWVVLDEVAFSLLKTQPSFVDELVSTLRKYYAGAVVVVQDLEKVTQNPAGAAILQNTQSKALFQQRGDVRTIAGALDLTEREVDAVDSLRRVKGSFADFFLIRDDRRCLIRHVASPLEYWLATSAADDNRRLGEAIEAGASQSKRGEYAEVINAFVRKTEEVTL